MQFCGRAEDIKVNRAEMLCHIRKTICGVDEESTCGKCQKNKQDIHICRLQEKSDEQLEYILSSNSENIYLEACAGSGKTEVLGIKAAYEICSWKSNCTGIAVLTFTNEAAQTIEDRISQLYKGRISSNHYIGTFSSFVQGYISQKFGCDIFQKQKTDKDKSFRIVDGDISQYDNNWLNTFKVEFPLNPKHLLYANSLYFKTSNRTWYTGQKETDVSLLDYYNNAGMQGIIKKYGGAPKYSFEAFIESVVECKKRFWRTGFATFEDMSLIARSCLSKEEIGKRIATKFPLIIVDECQDLSKLELELLSLLEEYGAVVHLIGDLNQSIYSFKDAIPDFISEHITTHSFKTMCLSTNYRSTQKIVDVSRVVAHIEKPITGTQQSLNNGDDCVYIESDSERDIVEKYKSILAMYGIPLDKSVILVRSNDFKSKIGGRSKNDYNKHPLINALQFWNINKTEERRRALKLLGWQLQKWFKTTGRADNYYFPSECCKDAIQWRLFLRNMLDELASISDVVNFDGLKYGEWYNTQKHVVIEIINKHILKSLDNVEPLTTSIIRTPHGTAESPIAILNEVEDAQLRVETVHSVKGCTFEAVLFISTHDARGKGGYWENWLLEGEETMRIGYVACTRPKHLLCWGVAELSPEQREKIEDVGLINSTKILTEC